VSDQPPGVEWDAIPVLAALVASAPDALYVVDAEGCVRVANPAALDVLGYPQADQLLGRPSHATIHHTRPDGSAFAEEDCTLLAPRTTGETVRVERDWFVRKDGSMVPVAYASAPLETPAGRGAIVSFRDITEQLHAEDALRAQAAQEARLEEVRASRSRLVETGERERRRLGRDLHDGAQQRLVQAIVELQLVALDPAGIPSEASSHLERALEATRAAIDDLRELAQGIHPRVLTDRGLRAALGALADRSPCPVEVDVPDERFPEPIEAAVYFVVAEALTNVAKHAEAELVRVSGRVADGALLVEITDDGAGGAGEGSGSGLRGLADRVAAAGGELTVESPAGDGTTLRARLPLSAAGT
jgi:PAS domain S-box-containing protein